MKSFFIKILGPAIVWSASALPLGLHAQDSAPVFVSRTGGAGKTWATVAALAADAKKGDPHACAQLGDHLLRGDGVPQDVPRAVALLEQAARAGIGSAAFRLGMLLDDGVGVAQDRRRALDYFRAAAAGGVMEAFHNVGAAYAGAHGVKRDYTEGLAWLILATRHGADAGSEQAVRARIQRLRRPEWIADAEKRAPVIEQELAATTVAARLPSPAPFAFNGSVPPAANSVAIDKNAPISTLPAVRTSAASPNDSNGPASAAALKVSLPTGRRTSWADFPALERAADRGDSSALAALGQALLEGKLAPADPLRAINVLERGAKAGSADAAHLLAEIYTKGQLTPRDDTKAFAYNLQAARGGSRQAMFNTGALYANGRGIERDYTAALTWLLVAKQYGVDPGAEKRIRTQLEKTAPDQIAIAEKRAADLQREIETAVADSGRS